VAFSADGSSLLAVKADSLFEYYLDPQELLMCADKMISPSSAPQNGTMTELCSAVELPKGITSIWSKAGTILDRYFPSK
jgi:hypothetical protein